MNPSKIKIKVTFLALCAIIFVCVLLALSVVLIHFCDKYKSKIAIEAYEIETLEDAEKYYNSDKYLDDTLQENGFANQGDKIFEEE